MLPLPTTFQSYLSLILTIASAFELMFFFAFQSYLSLILTEKNPENLIAFLLVSILP